MFWQMTLRASVQLSVEPLEEGYPLGEIRLGPGVVEPALARLVAGETVAQRGGAGVYLFHVPHGEGEAQRRRSVRQGRERVFPDEGRQQLDGVYRPGAFFGEQQRGGRTIRHDMQGGIEQLQLLYSSLHVMPDGAPAALLLTEECTRTVYAVQLLPPFVWEDPLPPLPDAPAALSLTLTMRDVEEIDACPAALGHRLACDKAGKRWLHHPRAETYLSERVALFQRLYR